MESQAASIHSLNDTESKQTTFTSKGKQMIVNIHKYVERTWPDQCPDEKAIMEKTANMVGIDIATASKVLKEHKINEQVKRSESKKMTLFSKRADDCDKMAIRKIILSYYLNSELPTFDKVLKAVNNDEQLSNFKRSTFERILENLKFTYIKRKEGDALIDKGKIVLWRVDYLRKIKEYRAAKRNIFYLDEIWVDADYNDKHTKKDLDESEKQLNRGSENSIKSKRLVAVHIGNENGFLPGAEEIFESKNTRDDKNLIEPEQFEDWFENLLPKLGENTVVVLDDAPYHSRRSDKTPTHLWLKESIQKWLNKKQIAFDEDEMKPELYEKVRKFKKTTAYRKYAVDELAKKYKVDVLRLPPFHFELNPVDRIWAEVKQHVTGKSTKSEPEDVKQSLQEAIQNVTADKWKSCVDHVVNLENDFYNKIDHIIDNTIDSFTPVSESESSQPSSSSDDASWPESDEDDLSEDSSEEDLTENYSDDLEDYSSNEE